MGASPRHAVMQSGVWTGGLTRVLRLRRAALVRDLITGGIWVAGGMALARASRFTSNLLLARIFGPAWLGQYALVMSNVNLFELFASSGVQKSATKLVAESRKDPGRERRVVEGLIGYVIVGGAVVSVVSALLASSIASRVYRLPELAGIIVISSPLVFLQAMLFALRGVLAGWSDFRALSLNTILQGLLAAALVTAGALLGGIGGAIVGNVVTCVVSVVLLYRFVSRRTDGMRLRLTGRDLEITREIRSLTTPIFLATLASFPVTYLSLALIARHPGGDVEAGLYQAAIAAKYAMTMVAGALASSFLPRYLAGRGTSTGDWEAANTGLALSLALVTGVPFLLFPGVVGWLFGPGFEGRAFDQVVTLVAASYGLTLLKDALQRRLLATNSMGWFARTNVLWGMCALAGVYATSSHGALSLAGSYLVADAAHLWLLVIGDRWRPRRPVPRRVDWLLLLGSLVVLVLAGIALIGWEDVAGRVAALVIIVGAVLTGGLVYAGRLATRR